jgi:serine/threonine-protein kinase
MEYVDGLAMSDKEFVRPVEELLRLFIEAALGFHAMHVAGYVHADIKPNNIMVTPDGQVKLIDFGQSHRLNEAKHRVQGTIDYMAPEQAQRGMLDQRTDVFGLGAALHRVLTGKPVLTAMNQTVSMHSQSLVGRRVDEIRQPVTGNLPTCITRLINDSCQSRPEHRISDMQSLAERLRLARAIVNKPASANSDFDDADLDDDNDDVAELTSEGAHNEALD